MRYRVPASPSEIPPPPVPWGALVTLAVILLVGLALRIVFFNGISGNDDLSVATRALAVLEHGITLPAGHYGARWGMILPLAAVFAVAGTGSVQLAVLPVLLSLAGIVLAWLIGRRLIGQAGGLAAAALVAVYPLDIQYATLYFPDLPQGVLLALSFYLVQRAEESPRPLAWIVGAALAWVWAYEIKIDSVFMGMVFLALTLTGRLRLSTLAVLCGLTGGLVVAELAAYGVLTGSPFYRLHLEQAAAAEVLSDAYTYRSRLVLPKAMFVTFYEVGLYFWMALAALLWAAWRRPRAVVPVVLWGGVLFLWLQFGGDPFGVAGAVKPQLPRYLLALSTPLVILIAWMLLDLARFARATRILAGAAMAGLVATSLFFSTFNLLNYQRPINTRKAVDYAVRNNLFPLYLDLQSYSIAEFLLHGGDPAHRIIALQEHNFLTGDTRIVPVTDRNAYILLNDGFIRELARRNLVQPVRIAEGAEVVYHMQKSLPAASYASLDMLCTLAQAAPLPGVLKQKIQTTASDVLEHEGATIYHLVHAGRPDSPG